MKTIRKIICALDLLDRSAHVARYAAFVAATLDAKVIVLHVIPPVISDSVIELHAKLLDKLGEELHTKAHEGMLKAMTEYFAGVKASSAIVEGRPAREILRKADAEKADMIIVGTHARVGIDHFLLGSVAEEIVKRASIPVLTIRQ